MGATRQDHHREGYQLMKVDNYLGALTVFKNAQNAFGPHLCLSADIACCYYMLGDVEAFQKMLSQITKDLNRLNGSVSEETFAKTSLVVAMLCEEIGEFSNAVIHYKKCLGEDSPIEIKWRAQSHLVRLAGLLDLKNEIRAAYRLMVGKSLPTSEVHFEFCQTMVTLDFELAGHQSARKRLLDLLKSSSIKKSEIRLILFDFAFDCMNTGVLIDDEISEIIEQHNYFELDHFERAVFDILLSLRGKTPHLDLNTNRSEQMPMLSGIKYLSLLYRYGIGELNEVHRKSIQLINLTDNKFHAQLIQKLGLSQSSIKWDLFFNGHTLHFGNTRLSTENFRLFEVLLKTFENSRSCDLEELSQNLYEMQLSASIKDRIRILVMRFNKKIRAELGVPKVFAFNKNTVSLETEINLHFGRSK